MRRGAVALVIAAVGLGVGCTRPAPDVDLPLLSPTDLDVVRTVLVYVVQPRLAEMGRPHATVMSPTRVVPLWHRPQSGTFPPAPPAEFRGSAPSPPMLPPEAIDDAELTSDEQRAWRARNRRALELPDLGLPGFTTRAETTGPVAEPTVVLSAPVFPTPTTAVVFADLRCGGLCGTGWLVRLMKARDRWRVIQQVVVLKR